ncbi:TonB-dependent receptor [Phenylobacterium immobile]|uniref:TonB-dependent receptor n=1 Tax=Phenylobacterium immobile TaxID=21 RepID=UPI000B1796A7|nr:TonB-dependent receptor [Phenylobacterium immobile]
MNSVKRALVYGALLNSVVAASAAFAQTAADAANTGVSEVVVTAERRTQSVQRSSLAISVISPEAAQQAGVVQVRDLTKLEPGVSIGQGGPATQIYIRGVGDFGSTPLTNPAVAVNVDGIYVARANSIEGNMHDIERIEVLKGPQGTLYGRNATGGAINIISMKPKLGVQVGRLQAEVGSYKLGRMEAAYNLPVGDTLAFRGAVQLVSRGGYGSLGFDDDKHESYRLQGLWEPNDDLSIRLSADRTHVGGRGPAHYIRGPYSAGVLAILNAAGVAPVTEDRISTPDPRAQQMILAAVAYGGLCYPNGVIPAASATRNGVVATSVQGFCPTGFSSLIAPSDPSQARMNNNFNNLSAEVNWDLGFATLTVLPGYRQARNDYTTFPFVTYDDAKGEKEKSDAYSFEARLGGETGAANWVAGLYYFREDQSSHSGSPNTVQFQGVRTDITKLKTESSAIFGQVTFNLSETLRLIAGGRYATDRRRINGVGEVYDTAPLSLPFQAAPVAGPCYLTGPVCIVSRYTGRNKDSNVTYKFGAEYDLTPQNMLFVTYGTGQKAGGFNAFALAGATANAASAYDPEKLAALEVGSRNRFLNSRLQVNLEAFHWKYKDAQQIFATQDVAGNFVFGYTNAGRGTMYGVDVDVVARLTANDTLQAGVELLRTKFNQFSYETLGQTPEKTGCSITPGAPFQTIDCSGKPLLRAPRYSGTVAYTHTFNLASGAAVEASGTAQFAGSNFLRVDYTEGVRSPSYVAGDVSLTYRNPERTWSLSAYGRNITNEVIHTGSDGNITITPTLYTTNLAPPRTFGVRFNVDF